METKRPNNLTVEFLKWCYTPIYKAPNGLKSTMRVIPQLPDYDTFVIIDDTGNSVLPKGTFLTAEQVHEYWLFERIGVIHLFDIND